MAEFGSCRSTKDASENKFIVLSCEGSVLDSAKTLDEAQVKADAAGCAIVIKVLRVCGGANINEIVDQLSYQVEEESYDEFDEED